MKKFDGILFCTDLDGTILKSDRTISKENLDAIEYFKSEGGKFTFITGRMPFFASQFYDIIRPNAPVGCINGGGLYDYKKGEYIQTTELSKKVFELIDVIYDNFPNIGIQVNTFHKVYFYRDNQAMQDFRKLTRLPDLVKHYREVTEPIAKIVFVSNNDAELLATQKMLEEHPLAEDFTFVRAEKTLFEILPRKMGKHRALEALAEAFSNITKTIAIGDYNNDITMLKAANLGIAVANATPDTKKVADLVTVSNEEHAIARVIEDLSNGNLSKYFNFDE